MEISDKEINILRGCCYKQFDCCKQDCCKLHECCHKTECCQPCCPDVQPVTSDRFYAQYAVREPNPDSGDNLSFLNVFNIGGRISLEDEQTILLPKGWLYKISYIFLASPGQNGYFEVVPYINNAPGLNYSFFAPAGAGYVNSSAAADFMTNLALNQDAQLRIRVSYARAANLDISGVVSIVPYRV